MKAEVEPAPLVLYNHVIFLQLAVAGERESGCTGSEPNMTVTFPLWEPRRASQTGRAQTVSGFTVPEQLCSFSAATLKHANIMCSIIDYFSESIS